MKHYDDFRSDLERLIEELDGMSKGDIKAAILDVLDELPEPCE